VAETLGVALDDKRSSLTIIALSGYGQEEDRAEARQAGCDSTSSSRSTRMS